MSGAGPNAKQAQVADKRQQLGYLDSKAEAADKSQAKAERGWLATFAASFSPGSIDAERRAVLRQSVEGLAVMEATLAADVAELVTERQRELVRPHLPRPRVLFSSQMWLSCFDSVLVCFEKSRVSRSFVSFRFRCSPHVRDLLPPCSACGAATALHRTATADATRAFLPESDAISTVNAESNGAALAWLCLAPWKPVPATHAGVQAAGTLLGRLFNVLGYGLAAYCVFKMLACLKSVLLGDDMTTDPVSRLLGLALRLFSGGAVHLDKKAASQYITLLFVGFVSFNSLRAFLKHVRRLAASVFAVVGASLSPSSAAAGADAMMLGLGALLCAYTVSSVMLLRAQLPVTHRELVTLALGFDSRAVDADFDAVHRCSPPLPCQATSCCHWRCGRICCQSTPFVWPPTVLHNLECCL